MHYHDDRLASPLRRLAASAFDLGTLAVASAPAFVAEQTLVPVEFSGSVRTGLAVATLAGLAGVAGYNVYLLRNRQQTWGKRLLGLQIEIVDDALLSLSEDPASAYIGDNGIWLPEAKRYVPFALVTFVFMIYVPLLIPILWVLIIAPMFGAARRGLHDYFGGSQVVEARGAG